MTDRRKDASELRSDLARKIAARMGPAENQATEIPGVTLHRRIAPTAPCSATYEPGVTVIAQGRNRVDLGGTTFIYGESRYLLTSLDLPIVSQIIGNRNLPGLVASNQCRSMSLTHFQSHCRIAVSCGALLVAGLLSLPTQAELPAGAKVAQGQSAFTDYQQERPGQVRKITVADLPRPFATESIDNGPHLIARPKDAWPQALPGFTVTEYATGLDRPRLIRRAPNGDLFVAESEGGRLKILRGMGQDGKAAQTEVYASDLHQPFGIAFYPLGPNPQYVYVANTDSVVRFAYQNGDLKARGKQEVIVPDLPGGGRLRGGGHWTRDIAFSLDGAKMFVSVGSHSNVDDADTHKVEFHRADILEFTPGGKNLKVFAYGIRNPVGIAVHPQTGQLWTSVNERDELGDNLVPDYITHVQEGGFYGWPWFYMGGNQDPRLQGKRPELKNKVITPDVLLQPHFASLQLTFYNGKQFPAEYSGEIFAAEHGSWNKHARAGYEVIRVPLANGHATGEYQDFLTGFVTADGQVWGRPVGVAAASDGALMVTDDGSNTVWRVAYKGQ